MTDLDDTPGRLTDLYGHALSILASLVEQKLQLQRGDFGRLLAITASQTLGDEAISNEERENAAVLMTWADICISAACAETDRHH